MKRFISILLTFVMLISLCATTVGATGGSSASTGSSGGGGGGGFVSGGTSASTPISLNKYTVSGTIYLPSGMTAPEGGLKIYGGFGGVSLSEVNTASLSSTEDYIEEESTIDYENSEVIATIPEGQNYVSYNTTCKIASSYDGIYGKFWVYDNVTVGNVTISNKQTISNIIQLKADVYNYANLNCILNSATNTATYTITCNSDLASENITTNVYVIADDGYDKYISCINYDNSSSASGVLNLESNGTYNLYYYIPSSSSFALQKLDKGLFNVGTLDTKNRNTIILKSQLYISGNICLPDDYVAEDDINITIGTVGSETDVIIPKGETSVSYVVGAFSEEGEYLQITVDDKYLISGYLCEDGSFDEYEYELWYEVIEDHTSIENFDITLQEQYIIQGQITLPEDVTMDSNTYFSVRVRATNLLTGYNEYTWVYILSDTRKIEYEIPVPKKQCNSGFAISYDYGSYSTVTIPTSAKSPLGYFKAPNSGGATSSGGGGGGSSSSAALLKDGVVYTSEEPDGLLYGCKLYLTDTNATLLEENAYEYEFSDRNIIKDFTLIKTGEIYSGMITGYFKNSLGIDLYTMIKVTLYDSENNIVDAKYIDDSDGYVFQGLNQGDYKIGFWYEDKQYYYNNLHLVENIDDAEIISLEDNIISTHNDVHIDNIFKTSISLHFEDIIINNNYYGIETVKIYDPYGNIFYETESDSTVKAQISRFYIGLGDYYVSEFLPTDDGEPYVITGLTDDIEKAYLFNAEYYDTLSEDFYDGGNIFVVNAMTELYNTPLTTTSYEIIDGKLNFTVTTKQPISEGEIIVAVYDESNRLIDITSVMCVSDEYEYSLSVDYSSDISKIKTMVWSSLTTLKPLGKVEEQTVISDYIYKTIASAYFTVDDTAYYINGNEYSLEIPPTVTEGVIYTTARTVGETLNCVVNWDDTTGTIIYTLDGTVCSVQIGSNIALVSKDGQEDTEVILSGEPIITNERTLIPFADISKIFGFEIYISSNGSNLAVFDTLDAKVKYAYDNGLLNVAKVDISSMNSGITRAELTSLVVELYENSTGNTIIPIEDNISDTDDVDILKACAIGAVNCYEDGTFKPNSNLTYAENITVLYRTVLKINNNLKDKYITVPDYSSCPSDGYHWATISIYGAKKLGLLDNVCYNEIEIDNPINKKDAIGIIANAFYQLSVADETEFLYLCNSAEDYQGILAALQSDLYEYYAYSKMQNASSDDIIDMAKAMYEQCSYYNSVEEFDSYLKTVFDNIFPSAPSSGNYS